MNKNSIMIFGVGELQKSIINRAHKQGLFVVGIDPCPDAFCKDDVDAFEIVGGQDFEGTLAAAKKHQVSAIVTAATDKPLVMMARIAKELKLPFYSVETAQWSTDKYQMKQHFIEGGVPCAKGMLIKSVDEAEDLMFPVIVKPRDNSGSRGVKLCRTKEELKSCMDEALQFSHLDSVLVEEFIEGQEYSIESLHYDGKTEVIQFTEKKTTEFPYNVELGHKQPANLSEKQKNEVCEIIKKIANALHFENCPSHTELKINDRGIFVIETSPRLGGDYITSTLVPLSTGINMEDQLINIALGKTVDINSGRINKASAVCFFCLPEGEIKAIDKKIEEVRDWEYVVDFDFKLNVGDKVNKITSSLDRYGQFIIQTNSREELDRLYCKYEKIIVTFIKIKELCVK
jgi:carbamoyl-phosphate synthase large subunit